MDIIKKPFYFGYGLLEAWVFLNFFLDVRKTSSVLDLSSGLSLVIIGLAFLALLSKRIGSISSHIVIGIIAALSATMFSLLAAWTNGMASLLLICASSVPNAWLWMAWAEVYSKITFEKAEIVSINSALAVILVVLILSPLPTAVSLTANALLPALSFVMYLMSMKDIRRELELEQELFLEHREERFNRKFYLRLFLGIGVPSTAVFVFMGALANTPAVNGFGSPSTALPLGLLLFVSIFVLVIKHVPSFSILGVFEAISCLVIAVCLFQGTGFSPVLSYSFTIAAWLAQDMLCWLLFARIYHNGYSDCIRTFAMGQSIMFSTALAGTLISWGLSTVSHISSASICLAISVILFATLMVLTWPSPQEKALTEAGSLTSSFNGEPQNTRPPSRNDQLILVARRYGLTSRESEVFLLLAGGRSAPFIRDELFISESTVRSHIKHIHAKMGVATKQDLLSLIEEELSAISNRPEV